MSHIYSTELHKFVEGYFKAKGAFIKELHDDFFVVVLPGGKTERYTYTPRIAGENKEIKLLARGSRHLKSMVQDCSSQAALSHVSISYSEESVREALKSKTCCDMCPFITICQSDGSCCDFCHNYKDCNTKIENASFLDLGEIKVSRPMDIICFIFSVELSNDYSLSQKIEKSVTILIDINTGEILNNVLARDFSYLALKPSEKTSPINSDDYSKLLKTARQGAEAAIKEQLDVFKKEIESPLRDKITAIIGKYEEDYIEGYTKTTMDQLEQLQSEALKLCEREIRGYTINSSFHLKNVIILDTSYDIRELVFKLDSMDKEVTLLSDIFLSRIDIKCNQCGMEIDSGLLCNNGHVLCKNCSELCSVCGSVICDICDHESFVCSTCGETVCPQCSSRCTSCGATVCSDHQYHCSTCGEECCIDCYEICSICESDVCSHHSSHCTQCGEPACHEHISDCAVCQKQFCMDHIGSCAICSKLLCESHSFNSAYSSRIVCEDHMTRCAVCDDVFADDEVENCKECMDELCPSHVKRCSICNNIFCSKHINHCRDCGREICSCTHFSTCKLCGEEFCSDCLSGNGYCSACRGLSSIDKNDEIIKYVASQLPAIDRFRKFYLGRSKELKTLYAKGLFQNYLVVLNNKYEVLSSKEIGFMDDLKRKLIRK